MSDPGTGGVSFGCAVCRTVPAARGDLRLVRVRNLFEDPHEGYAMFECPDCRRPFLEQFQEITWLPGGDDIWLRWMPLTDQERDQIDALFPAATEDGPCGRYLAELMFSRGRLVCDPTGTFAWYDPPRDAGNMYGP